MGRRLDLSFLSWRLQGLEKGKRDRAADEFSIQRTKRAVILKIDAWQECTQLPLSRPLVQQTMSIVMKTLEQNNSLCLKRCIEAWRTRTIEKRTLRAMTAPSTNHHTYLTAWSILLHWLAISRERRQRRARMLSRLAAVLRVNRTVAQQSQASETVAQFVTSNAQMYVGITLIWQSRCCLCALKTWRNILANAVRDRAVSAKCCLRRNRLTLEQTWSSWLNLAQKHRMVRILCRRMTRRGRHFSLSWAWEYLCYNHSQMFHENQVDIGLERLKKISVRRMISAVLARYYNGWCEHHFIAKRQRLLSMRMEHLLASKVRAKAVNAWYRSLVVTRRASKAAARLRLCSFIALSGSFHRWQRCAKLQLRMSVASQCIMKQWCVGRQALSFMSWHAHAHQQARECQVIARTVQRCKLVKTRVQRRMQARVWGIWEEETGGAKRLRAVEARAIGRWRYRAWVRWLVQHAETRRIRRTAASIHFRITDRLLKEARLSWQETAQQTRRERLLYTRAVRCWRRRCAKSVLRRWKLLMGLRAQDRLRNKVETISLRRLMTTSVHQIFVQWSAQVRSSRLWTKMAHRLSRRFLHRICLSWQDTVREGKGLRSRAQKAVALACRRSSARSLSRWWCDVVMMSRKRHKASRMRRAQLLSAVLRSWRATLVDRKRSRALAARAMSRLNSAAALMWRAWTEWVFHVLGMRAAKDRTGLSLVLCHASITSPRPNHSLGVTDMLDTASPRHRGIC